MATTFQPFGLKPVYHPSGLDRAVPFVGTNTYGVGSGNYTAPYQLNTGESFYQYQPVQLRTSSSSSVLGIADVTATTSPANNVYGVFDGVEYTTAEGRRTVGKYASKLTLDAATDIVFWIFQDPALVYEAQVRGPVTTGAIGKQFNFDSTSGSSVTDGVTIGVGGAGFSKCALASSASSSGGQVRVVGLGREVAFPAGETNTWGDAYTIVQVQFANNAFVANRTL
jgi:hypothetical protein